MQVEIKLYGHLLCQNESLESFNMNRFKLHVQEGAALAEIHKLIFVNPVDNLVSIVNGKAQKPDFILEHSSIVSIFPPMGGRTHNPFERI